MYYLLMKKTNFFKMKTLFRKLLFFAEEAKFHLLSYSHKMFIFSLTP